MPNDNPREVSRWLTPIAKIAEQISIIPDPLKAPVALVVACATVAIVVAIFSINSAQAITIGVCILCATGTIIYGLSVYRKRAITPVDFEPPPERHT